jgi:hypothetical protein
LVCYISGLIWITLGREYPDASEEHYYLSSAYYREVSLIIWALSIIPLFMYMVQLL